jgi:hypothetical protein
VIHEAALRIMVSDRAAARAQLTHILEQSAANHISVRVIPFDLEFSTGSSPMTYVGGGVPRLDTVIRDAPHGALYVDSAAELATYQARFEKTKAMSLERERSRDFIHRLAKEL